nr:PREDICTED: RNA-binding protein NOB1 [Bemisia tabaci]
MPKAQVLIVDTNAFIQSSNLQDIGEKIVTCTDVLEEVKNKRQLRRLAVVPYDIQVLEPFPENIKFVTEFSKKTGDYRSLSATDIKIIALTYQLEKEKVGSDHLATEPKQQKEICATKKSVINLTSIPGFYYPKSKNADEDSGSNSDVEAENEVCEKLADLKCNEEESKIDQVQGETSDENKASDDNEPTEEFQDAVDSNFVVNMSEEGCEGSDNNSVDDDDDFEDDDSSNEDYEVDDEGWITPENIIEMKRKMGGELIEDKPVVVGCLTMDFAMQNVLKQIGLNLVTIDGYVIKQLRTFIFRCYSCFKTTSIMTKIFCPNCGNKTLKKVAVSLDENGKQVIHINFRRRLTGKGKKHSIPTPKGGKHVVRPITVADQPMPKQHASKLSKTKNNPLDPDYIAGYSPFVMRDVNSKSAMLGIYSNRFINDPRYMKQVSKVSESSKRRRRRK